MIFNIEEFISDHITLRKKSLFDEDLANYDAELRRAIQGKAVLVIGGAGTIGSSFIKALLKFEPGKLVVVDINENGLTELVRDCRSQRGIKLPANYKSYPVSLGEGVFEKIFWEEGYFDIVANFAAHKHVRSEKDIFSIEAMIENNVFKAKFLLDILSKRPPAHFFCVSTDKAANPVNVMGASKKLMEEFILAYANDFKITTARFANVAFSNGSLLAGFVERMAKRQPLSCPTDVKRFFVSPDESGQICLLACILGEPGNIIFPKLDQGKLVSFADIVQPFLAAYGYSADICASEEEARQKTLLLKSERYPVYFFTSDTDGEKKFEEFYTQNETVDYSVFKQLGVVRNAFRRDKQELDRVVANIRETFQSKHDKHTVISLLTELIPNFSHIETGMNLDQKM